MATTHAMKLKKAKALIDELASAKEVLQGLKADVDTIQDDVLKALHDLDVTTLRTDDGNNATVVAGSRVTIDDSKLSKSLGAKLWQKITVRKLDPKLLDDAIAKGVVDKVLVAAASSETPTKPYIRLTIKGGE